MRSKKPPITFSELLKTSKKDIVKDRYKTSISEAIGDDPSQKIEDNKLSVGKYSLKTRILKSPWVKSGRPATKALSWLYKEVLKQPEKYRYNKNLMFQGNLFTFEYVNPKLKGTKQLPWFDKYPLVLSLGPVVTNEGIRNLGFNLHLVPPKVRIIILCTIFEMYKRLYRYQIFYNKIAPVQIRYQHLIKPLLKYGADFCIRMYIPSRQRQIVKFPYNEWYKAIFIPSRGYDGIRAAKLVQAWTKHLRGKGFGTSSEINWKSNI